MKVLGGPVHELAVGVTVIVAEIGAVPVLVAVNDGIKSVVPLAPSPIFVLLLVHVNVVPLTGLVKKIEEVLAPLQ